MTAPTGLAMFDYDGEPIRTIVADDGAVWFVAADVARVLGYRDSANLTRRIHADDRGTRLVSTPSGEQAMSVISEPGLYVGVIRSEVDGARRFQHWITHEVLPSIRATGSYSAPTRELSRLELIDLARDSEVGRLAAEAQVAELAPAAAAWTALADAAGDYSLREAAEILCRANINTGQNILARQLKEIGWTDRRGRPYQSQINNGRLAVRTRTYDDPYTGEPQITTQIRITGKGVDALYRAFTGTSLALVGAP